MENPFSNFWMGGFECSDKLNAFGDRVDFLTLTGHLDHLDEDYKNIASLNITTVREGIRWNKVEYAPYKYNWTHVIAMFEAAKRHNIQQVWDICHFGYADDLTPFHPKFPGRFVALCKAFLVLYRLYFPTEDLIITPINEVGFISWLGGDVKGTTPYCNNYGWQVKYALMRAYIEGVKMLKQEDDSVVILSSEPLVNMVAPLTATSDEKRFAQGQHEAQYQVSDMLTGRICPELGGRPEYLDIVGLNFYYNNQWVSIIGNFLIWKDAPADVRWRPLNKLVEEVYKRYNKPVAITETSHPKEDRPLWFKMIGEQCKMILNKQIPLFGVCIYPVIDRPDWDNLTVWHRSGLWDIDEKSPKLDRTLYQPAADAVLQAQQLMQQYQSPSEKQTTLVNY